MYRTAPLSERCWICEQAAAAQACDCCERLRCGRHAVGLVHRL